MLSTVRRGPFATSTQEERIEFLLTRMRKQDCKVAFADHALEHVLSFQRRCQSIKQEFLRRGASTPLGIPQETILCFFGEGDLPCVEEGYNEFGGGVGVGSDSFQSGTNKTISRTTGTATSCRNTLLFYILCFSEHNMGSSNCTCQCAKV